MTSQYQGLLFVVGMILSLVPLSAKAQGRVSIGGKVIDVRSGEPLPFAAVRFAGTDIGVTTDEEGFFQLEADREQDSITVSFIGYTPVTLALPVDLARPILIALEASAVTWFVDKC